MYNTEKNPGFNLKDIIIKAIFLVLFILLLVWLFPKVPNMKPFYSNVFRENIKYMQDAAESYYTTEKLPKNIGDTAEMTLQDMIDKNLILPFVDEDGNSCDTKKSYVEVKKNKNDYTLKVNLVCPNEENFVEKTLGCYEYCEDCKEEETKPVTALEYQFKQTGSKDASYYSCPDGGTLTNGVCNIYTTNKYKATITTTKGTSYCKNGGVLKDGKCYITKTTSYKASTKEGSYYCPDGGTLNGSTCYVGLSNTYEASVTYTCPKGGYVSGSKCIVEEDVNGTSYSAKTTYYCPNGGSLSGSKCITSKGTQGSSYPATKKTTGGYLGGPFTTKPAGATCTTTRQRACSTCTKFVTVYTACTVPEKTTYSCPNGGSISGTTCYISGTSEKSYAASSKLSCPNGGSLKGSRCVEDSYTEISAYQATKIYNCPNGGALSGTTCKVTGSRTYNATKSQGEQYCPNGGTLSNGQCVKTETTSYAASVTDGTSTKTCPDGGSLKDDGYCYVNKLSKSYNATLNTKKQYYTNYKWSREESLPGWTRTGETRTVTVENTNSNKQK